MSRLAIELSRALKRADPDLKTVDSGYGEAMVLLGSLLIGADEDEISRQLEYNPDFVRQVGSRLRPAGIWSGDSLAENHKTAWDDPETGGIAFWLDHGVATGALIIANRIDGEPRYRQTDTGRKMVERLLDEVPKAK